MINAAAGHWLHIRRPNPLSEAAYREKAQRGGAAVGGVPRRHRLFWQGRRAEADKRADTLQLADAFEQRIGAIVDTVASAATEMQATAQAMSTTAERTTREVNVVAGAAGEASTSVATIASAAEQLSASIGEITRQIAQSAAIPGNAVSEASSTDATVEGLAAAAQRSGTWSI
jgi:methyl-accepting chemotaxis protein